MSVRTPAARAIRNAGWVGAVAVWMAAAAPPPLPRALILFIGDGMGTGQVAAARAYAGRPLSFENWPISSRAATREANGFITDSAAAGTALATGRKVTYGTVSVAVPGDGSPLETLLELAHRQGKRAGLVTTSYLLDATPAAFGAHAGNRGNFASIATDYLEHSRPEVLLGGGGFGLSTTSCAAAGYTVVVNRDELLDPAKTDGPRLAGLFGGTSMPYELDGLGNLPHLHEMTRVALRALSTDPDGFFLMVEGGTIDYGGHANHLPRTVAEVLEFENAVNEAVTWAQTHPDTLILVTADHETGGLEVLNDNGAGEYPDVQWSTSGHTASPVPVYAWGRGAGRARWIADNTEVHACLADPLFPPPRVLRVGHSPSEFEIDWIAASGRVYQCWSAAALDHAWQFQVGVTGAVDAAQTLRIPGADGAAIFVRMTDEE